jgi:hypothetical protein
LPRTLPAGGRQRTRFRPTGMRLGEPGTHFGQTGTLLAKTCTVFGRPAQDLAKRVPVLREQVLVSGKSFHSLSRSYQFHENQYPFSESASASHPKPSPISTHRRRERTPPSPIAPESAHAFGKKTPPLARKSAELTNL